jgi:hypothetical protein
MIRNSPAIISLFNEKSRNILKFCRNHVISSIFYEIFMAIQFRSTTPPPSLIATSLTPACRDFACWQPQRGKHTTILHAT